MRPYDRVLTCDPNPGVALDRAVAVVEAEGAAPALRLVEPLPLGSCRWFRAGRADLLRRLGHVPEARAAYERALALTHNESEHAFLLRRQRSSGADPGAALA